MTQKTRLAPPGSKASAPSKTWIIERLATFYTEAVCKNPKDSVYDNIARAVERLPVVANAWQLLEALEEIADKTTNEQDRIISATAAKTARGQ